MKRYPFWPDRRQSMLLHAVLDEPDRAREPAMRWLAAVDFDRLDAGSQRLLPMLSDRLKRLQIEHPLRPRITGFFRRSWYLDQRMRGQLRLVRSACREAGIDCMLLKGAALGPEVYGTGALRPADDIDLLVRHTDFDAAAEQLVRGDWRLRPGERRSAAWLDPRDSVAHALTYESEVGTVDLHVSPFHEVRRHAVVEGLWFDRRQVDVDGAPADLLSMHDQLLHTLVHGLRVNETPPIRWIVDAVLCIRRYGDALDWDRFALRAAECNYTLVAGRGLRFLAREFSAPVPDATLRRLAAYRAGWVERIDYSLGRQGWFVPLVKMALVYRDGARLGPVERLRAIVLAYHRAWQPKGPAEFLGRIVVRLLLGPKRTARLYWAGRSEAGVTRGASTAPAASAAGPQDRG